MREVSTESSGVRGAAAGGAAVSAELRTAIDRLRTSMEEMGSNRGATTAMANLAEAIQGLVQHMRAEQQMIRELGGYGGSKTARSANSGSDRAQPEDLEHDPRKVGPVFGQGSCSKEECRALR